MPVNKKSSRIGRPNRISREEILQVSVDILRDEGLEGFSMVKVAKRVGAATMSLYTYFPDRAGLQDAATRHIFGTCEIPAPTDDWRQWLQSWADSVYTLFERWPVAIDLLHRENRLAPTWRRIWLPLVSKLADIGFRGEALAFAAASAGNAILGSIQAQHGRSRIASYDTLLTSDPSNETATQLLAEVDTYFRDLDGRQFLTFAVENLIAGLERLLIVPAPGPAPLANPS